jgi:hypothetical protein
VTIANTEEQLARALLDWGYGVGSVKWPDRPLVFVAQAETSDCHAVVRGAVLDGDTVAIEIGLERRDSCTSDNRPRSFVLDVGAEVITSVTVNGSAARLDLP